MDNAAVNNAAEKYIGEPTRVSADTDSRKKRKYRPADVSVYP